jgi:hypothetical protein
MKEESLFCDPAVEIYTTTHTEMLFYTLQRAISGISYHDANRIRERGGERKKKKTGKASFERRGNKICQSTSSSVAAAAAAAAEPYYIYRI